MTTMDSQFGVVDESTYGTAVTVSRFFEYNTWNVKLDPGRTESTAIRPGTRTQIATRYEPFRRGCSGSVALDVPTKGFGWWLDKMLGSVSTGSATDSNYPHTAIEGSLYGKIFTAQANKPFHPAGTNQAHTYTGGKLVSWELACDVEGVLVLTGDLDFQDESTAIALATASYPTDFRVFSFAGGTITLDGSQIDIRDFRAACNLGLNVDRRFLRGDALKKEPTENAHREYTASFQVDHEDLTVYDFVRAAARVDNIAPLVATFEGPIAHGGTTLPSLQISIPAFRLDAADFDISGPDDLVDTVSGMGLDDLTNSPMTLVYTTTDATP